MLTKKVFIILFAGFVMTSCNKEDSLPANGQEDSLSTDILVVDNSTVDETQPTDTSTKCETAVIKAESGNPVSGTARLIRTDNKISMTCKIDDLTPGNVYTIWWLIWNKPEECAIPYACDEIDFDISEIVEVDALYAAGHVVGNNGKGNFSGSLNENDTSGSVNDLFDLPAYGLQDARTAEVHLVLRDHGPKIPGQIKEQMSSYSGGCTINECTHPMFAVFSPDCVP